MHEGPALPAAPGSGGDGQRSKYAAPALEKGLAILELLSSTPPLPSRVIADRLGLSKSQIFRVLAVLQDRGYIERRKTTDDFVITDRLFELGLRTPRVRGLMDAALPAMQDLATRIGQSCHLTVPHRGHSVVVARVDGGKDVSFAVHLGYRRVLTDSLSGRVLLAFQPPDLLHMHLADARALGEAEFDDVALAAALELICRTGHAIAQSRDVVGVTDIACPILDAQRAIACLGVPFLNRLNPGQGPDDVAVAAVATATIITDAIGG